jgi:hypothetical protein
MVQKRQAENLGGVQMVQTGAEDKALMHPRNADGSKRSSEGADGAVFSLKSLGIFQALRGLQPMDAA